MSNNTAQKTCTLCNTTKPVSEFGRQRANSSGFRARCKICENASTRARYHADIEKSRAAGREKGKRLYRRNDGAAKMRAYLATPTGRAKRGQWINDNRDKLRANALRWYYSGDRARNIVHRHRHRTRARQGGGSVIPYTTDQLVQRFSMYGFRCWICGDPMEELDHVKPIGAGGTDCLSNCRPACLRCNRKKHAKWPFDVRQFRRALAQ